MPISKDPVIKKNQYFMECHKGWRLTGLTGLREDEVSFEIELKLGFRNVKGILAAPPKATPTRNKGLIRPY